MNATEEEVLDALRILEEILGLPSVNERDARVKRRTRLEMKRLLARGPED